MNTAVITSIIAAISTIIATWLAFKQNNNKTDVEKDKNDGEIFLDKFRSLVERQDVQLKQAYETIDSLTKKLQEAEIALHEAKKMIRELEEKIEIAGGLL